jgi:ATP-dependent helicase/nuclease subunit A
VPLQIYKSSAGSGKTYTLTREFIRLVVRAPYQYRQILAITFTNKATAEMKNRIVSKLGQLAANTDPKYAEALLSLLPASFTLQTVQQNAAKALSLILHNYGEFSVCTIDSFFQQLLRSFTRELKLPYGYDLLLDSNLAIEQAAALLLLEIGNNDKPNLTKWIVSFALEKWKEDKGFRITSDIESLGKNLLDDIVWDYITNNSNFEEGLETENEMQAHHFDKLKQFLNSLQKIRRNFENELIEKGKQVLKEIEENGFTQKDFKNSSANIFKYFSEGDFDKIANPTNTLSAIFRDNNIEGWLSKEKSKDYKLAKFVRDFLHPEFMAMMNFIEVHKKNYFTAKAILGNFYSYGLLNALKEKITQFRTEQNIMLLADNSKLMRSVLQGELAFIFEKAGLQYKHVFIDEFQDTSTSQWDSLAYLVQNALSQNDEALLVGDVKQSIYRWRGGNFNLLLAPAKHLGEKVSPFVEEKNIKNLTTNYRSGQNIIAFNNAFFTTATKLICSHSDWQENLFIKEIKTAYEDVKQEATDNKGGYITFETVTKNADSKPTEDTESKNEISNENAEINKYDSAESWGSAESEVAIPEIEKAVINRIEKLIEKQGYQYADIAILVRKNAHGAQIAKSLTNAKIPVISSEALFLTGSPTVRLTISVLKYLNAPLESIYRTQLLYQYLQYINELPSPEFLHLVYTDFNLQANDPKSIFATKLPPSFIQNQQFLARQPLYELVENITAYFELDTSNDPYLRRFLDFVLECLTNKISRLPAFLAYWERLHPATGSNLTNAPSVILPEGLNAVQILTIHKSKGLEFPVVILPYADWDTIELKKNTIIWADANIDPYNKMGTLPLKFGKELGDSHFETNYQNEIYQQIVDNLNILYVALTRAERELHIISKPLKKSKTSKDTASLKTIQDLFVQVLNHPDFEYSDSKKITGDYAAIESIFFAYGEPTLPPNLNPDEKISEQADNTENDNHTNKILPTHPAKSSATHKIKLASNAQQFFMLLDPNRAQAVSMGQKVHQVLENLQSPERLQKVLRQLKAQGHITQADEAPLNKRIEQIFNFKEVINWFNPPQGWEIITEQALIDKGQQYRPDRVLINENRAVIIDFKTIAPNAPDGIRKNHHWQVKNYARILTKMGYTVVLAKLLYIGIDNAWIEEVNI